MKKKIVAVVLSMTLCMATVLQTGAAAFGDQDDPAAAVVFDDSSEETQTSGTTETVLVQEPEGTPAAETPETVTPAPEVFETVTPTPEETPVPETPGDEAALPEEETPDMDIFTSGEGEGATAEIPAEPDAAAVEEEFLTAPSDRIYISNWKEINGKWKLQKPSASALNAAAAASEDLVTAPAETQDMAEETVFPENPAETGASAETVSAETPSAVSEEEIPSAEENASTADTVPEGETVPEEAVLPQEDVLNASSAPEYYTQADGIVHIKTYQSVGQPDKLVTEGDYYFDKDGYMVTGQVKIPAGTSGFPYTTEKEAYFMTEEKAASDNADSDIKLTPANSDLGKMQKKYWLWTGKAFRYYSSNGGFLSVSTLKSVQLEEKTYTGCYSINGEKYILDKDGVPRVGHIKITDGKAPGWYYGKAAENSGDIPGKLVRSSWIKLKDSKGQIQWRKYLSDGRFWNKGVVATKLDKTIDSSVGDYTYLLSASGYIIKSKMQLAADKYYYGTDKYGRVYKSKLVKFGNARYYFDSKGHRVSWTNSWHRIASSGNRYYYFGKTKGKVTEKKGWQRIIKTNGKSAGWFYFTSKGDHYVNKLTSAGRYFRTDGRLASGITTVNGKTYFFQGSTTKTPKGKMYKNTWIRYKNKWYYASSNGTLYKSGWKKIKGGYYYFNKDYTVKTNAAVTRNGKRGYVDSKGKFHSAGWVIVNDAKNQVKYIDPSTGKFAVNCSKTIDGLKYYFDKNGYRINDLTGMYRGPYYLVADRINGVMTVYDSSRKVPVKSIRISVGLPSSPTWPANKDMRLTSYQRWQPLMGPSWGQYGTHVDGAGNGGIFVHSVAGSTKSYYNLPAAAYNQLGNPASHGCIRCCVADARWVFYNCNGSTIRIIDGKYNANESFKGPLGRRALVPLYGSKNFDPTDNLAWHR